jgi:hypothetical protein
MTKYINQKRIKGPILKKGDKVYLFRRNIKTKHPSDKLNYKKIGLFEILKKQLNTNYKLSLPKGIKQHNNFYISLLKLVPENIKLKT